MFWRIRKVRLHLKQGEPSVEGVLVRRPGAFFRLLDAGVVSEAGQTHAVEGELFVPSGNVLFWQELSA